VCSCRQLLGILFNESALGVRLGHGVGQVLLAQVGVGDVFGSCWVRTPLDSVGDCRCQARGLKVGHAHERGIQQAVITSTVEWEGGCCSIKGELKGVGLNDILDPRRQHARLDGRAACEQSGVQCLSILQGGACEAQ